MADVAVLGLKVDATGAIVATDTLARRLNNLGAEGVKASSTLTDGFKRIAGAVSAALVIRKFVDESVAAQNAQAQLEAAVRSTGGAAGRTVEQLQTLASALQDVSTFSDEAVQGAQSLLLTFTKIKGDTFDDATRAVVDLASRMGGDLNGAALQLGKALQDPAKGLTALTRSGVSFTGGQKALIEKLTETGRLADAQRVILAELRNEFGGSAAAARNTLGGALTFVGNKFGELFEVTRAGSGGLIGFLNTVGITLGVIKANADAFFALAGGIGAAGLAYIAYASAAKAAALYTALIGAAQTIAAFISLAKGIRSAADAMALLSLVGKGAAGAVAAIAAVAVGFVAYKALASQVAAETAKFNAELDKLASQGGTAPPDVTTPGLDPDAIKAAKQAAADREREVAALNAANADRVRLAQQEYDLIGLTGEALARQRVENTAINAGLAARNDLALKLIGLEGAALEQQKTRNALDLAGIERSIERVRQTELAGVAEQGILDRREAADKARLDRVRQALSDLKGESPFKIPQAETEQWADALQSVVGVVQLLASAFGDVGNEIAKAATGAQSIVSGVKAASSIKNAAGQGVGIGTALSGTAGAAALASGVGAVGAIAAGAVQVADAFDLFGRRAQEAAEALRDLRVAAKNQAAGFALQASGSPLERELAALEGTFKSIIKALLEAGAPRGNLGTRKAASIVPTADDVNKAIESYDRLVAAAVRAAAFQEAQSARELAARLAAANGRLSEAEAIRQQLADEKELEDARVAGADAARLLQIAEVQAAESRARLAKKAEDERRSLFDLNNGIQAFNDPRGAGQAAFAEAQQRRYNDAVARGAGAMELLTIQIFNLAEAADRAAQILEADTRSTESLLSRALNATGNTQSADNVAFAAGQRQELADAVRAGMSPSNLAFLQFVQFAEREARETRRAIEEGTKAIQDRANNEIAAIDLLIEVTRDSAAAQIKALDEQIAEQRALITATTARFDGQIKAIREQTKAQTDAIDAQIDSARQSLDLQKAQLSALDKNVATNLKVVEALTAFSNSLKLGDLSTLSPEAKLAEARAQFEAQATLAQGGNADAAANLPNAANALLQASRAFNASSPGFTQDFDRVQAVVDAVTRQFGATLPVDQLQLEALRQQVAATERSIDALGRQKDAITNAAEAQITVLEEAKAAAIEQAQAIIDKLEQQKATISEEAAATIAKLEETKTAIQKGADALIAQLIKDENAKLQTRLRENEFYDDFIEYAKQAKIYFGGPGDKGIEKFDGDPVRITAGGTATTTDAITSAITELKAEVKALREQNRVLLERSHDNDERMIAVAVAASRAEISATDRVAEGVARVANETRSAAQAAAARPAPVAVRR
jgi:hypothetical protein